MILLGIVSYLPNNNEREEHFKLLLKNINSYSRIKDDIHMLLK